MDESCRYPLNWPISVEENEADPRDFLRLETPAPTGVMIIIIIIIISAITSDETSHSGRAPVLLRSLIACRTSLVLASSRVLATTTGSY
jgi:hypothetical protein